MSLPITLDEAARRYPTLAATAPHESRSSRYQLISTMDVLTQLVSRGFEIAEIDAARVRDPGHAGFEKHMVTLRQPTNRELFEEFPELRIINSHDGLSSWHLHLGLRRKVCDNGLILGNSWADIRVPHSGKNTMGRVIDAAYEVVETADKVLDRVESLKRITLEPDHVHTFATRAHGIVYGEDSDTAPVSPDHLTMPRRYADHRNDLWTVFNRVQENVMRGGLKSRRVSEATGRMRRVTTRPVKAIAKTLHLNQRLFDLAENFADNLNYCGA